MSGAPLSSPLVNQRVSARHFADKAVWVFGKSFGPEPGPTSDYFTTDDEDCFVARSLYLGRTKSFYIAEGRNAHLKDAVSVAMLEIYRLEAHLPDLLHRLGIAASIFCADSQIRQRTIRLGRAHSEVPPSSYRPGSYNSLLVGKAFHAPFDQATVHENPSVWLFRMGADGGWSCEGDDPDSSVFWYTNDALHLRGSITRWSADGQFSFCWLHDTLNKAAMSAAERDLPLAIEKWKDGSRHSRGAEERLGNVADDEEWVEGLAPRDIDVRDSASSIEDTSESASRTIIVSNRRGNGRGERRGTLGQTRNAEANERYGSPLEPDSGMSSKQSPPDIHWPSRCPYCKTVMPSQASTRLRKEYYGLRELSAQSSRPLDWTQTWGFCNLHTAESIDIPAGIAAGYPTDIDFLTLVTRLHVPWRRALLASLAQNPASSRHFVEITDEVRRMGRLQWKGSGHQGRDEVRIRKMAGFYGQLGSSIITLYLKTLLSCGFFTSFEAENGVTPACAPLTASDFVDHVLVPQVANSLILEDLHPDTPMPPADIVAALERADEVRQASALYGQAAFADEVPWEVSDQLGDIQHAAKDWVPCQAGVTANIGRE